MWQKITDEVGDEKRDSLWSHPDLLPTSQDIDDPTALIARLSGLVGPKASTAAYSAAAASATSVTRTGIALCRDWPVIGS